MKPPEVLTKASKCCIFTGNKTYPLMNLIYQLRNLFTPRREAALPAPASSCKELLSNLDQLCARLPEGEAFLITGDGEFTVRLTWKPQTEKPARRTFSLNGHNEAVEWVEDGDTTEENKTEEQKDKKDSKQRQMMQRLTRYLKLHYTFRYNLLTERTECARLNTEAADDSHHLIYTPVDNRTLNGIALGAMEDGVDC